jgi:diaminopimelate epimerase
VSAAAVRFVKMVAAGNDFVLVDADSGAPPADLGAFGSWACQPRTGVGADGLVVVRRDGPASIQVTVVNPDGSVAKMCGNGARCAVRHVLDGGMAGPVRVALGRHRLTGRRAPGPDGDLVEVTSPPPGAVAGPIRLAGLDGLEFHTVDTGTEYAVALVPDVAALDVAALGRAVRYHERFDPAGTSVSFAQVRGDTLAVRTYERGNEAETLSCGSAAVACVVVARTLGVLPGAGRTAVQTRSGWPLLVGPDTGPPPAGTVTLTGPAEVVFTGELRWPGPPGHAG